MTADRATANMMANINPVLSTAARKYREERYAAFQARKQAREKERTLTASSLTQAETPGTKTPSSVTSPLNSSFTTAANDNAESPRSGWAQILTKPLNWFKSLWARKGELASHFKTAAHGALFAQGARMATTYGLSASEMAGAGLTFGASSAAAALTMGYYKTMQEHKKRIAADNGTPLPFLIDYDAFRQHGIRGLSHAFVKDNWKALGKNSFKSLPLAGGFMAMGEAAFDFRDGYKKARETDPTLSRWQFFRNHWGKYTTKATFGMGAAAAGYWGLDTAMDHIEQANAATTVTREEIVRVTAPEAIKPVVVGSATNIEPATPVLVQAPATPPAEEITALKADEAPVQLVAQTVSPESPEAVISAVSPASYDAKSAVTIPSRPWTGRWPNLKEGIELATYRPPAGIITQEFAIDHAPPQGQAMQPAHSTGHDSQKSISTPPSNPAAPAAPAVPETPAAIDITALPLSERVTTLTVGIDRSGLSERALNELNLAEKVATKGKAPWATLNLAYYRANGFEGMEKDYASAWELALVARDVAEKAGAPKNVAAAEKFLHELQSLWNDAPKQLVSAYSPEAPASLPTVAVPPPEVSAPPPTTAAPTVPPAEAGPVAPSAKPALGLPLETPTAPQAPVVKAVPPPEATVAESPAQQAPAVSQAKTPATPTAPEVPAAVDITTLPTGERVSRLMDGIDHSSLSKKALSELKLAETRASDGKALWSVGNIGYYFATGKQGFPKDYARAWEFFITMKEAAVKAGSEASLATADKRLHELQLMWKDAPKQFTSVYGPEIQVAAGTAPEAHTAQAPLPEPRPDKPLTAAPETKPPASVAAKDAVHPPKPVPRPSHAPQTETAQATPPLPTPRPDNAASAPMADTPSRMTVNVGGKRFIIANPDGKPLTQADLNSNMDFLRRSDQTVASAFEKAAIPPAIAAAPVNDDKPGFFDRLLAFAPSDNNTIQSGALAPEHR